MAKATLVLSSSTYPTMGDLHMIFPIILNVLHDALGSEIEIKKQIAQRMYRKFYDYWAILQRCCSISVILDPNMKLSSFDDEMAKMICETLYDTYIRYANKEPVSLLITED